MTFVLLVVVGLLLYFLILHSNDRTVDGRRAPYAVLIRIVLWAGAIFGIFVLIWFVLIVSALFRLVF